MTVGQQTSRAKWRAAHRDHIRRYNAAYNAAHTTQIAAWHAEPRNKEKASRRARGWAAKHPRLVKKARSGFRRRNPGYNTTYATGHKQAKRSRIPAWAIEFFMQETYGLARLRTKASGFKWEVDHIVPLRSPLVCGLHCESNLRVIPKSQNCSKGNRTWPYMPSNAASRPLALLQQPF